MSIFTRPDSPPPRQLSPEPVTYSPLPLRARKRTTSGRITAVRSCNDLRSHSHSHSLSHSLIPPSPARSHFSDSDQHRRASTLSHAIPYRSPPLTPTIPSPPPPVPPIPAFVLNSPHLPPDVLKDKLNSLKNLDKKNNIGKQYRPPKPSPASRSSGKHLNGPVTCFSFCAIASSSNKSLRT